MSRGRLVRADNHAALSGLPLTLWHYIGNGHWSATETAKTDSRGLATFHCTISSTTTFRVRFDGMNGFEMADARYVTTRV